VGHELTSKGCETAAYPPAAAGELRPLSANGPRVGGLRWAAERGVPRGGGPGGVSGGPGWVWVWGWAASWAFSLQAVPVDGQRGRAHRSRSDQLSTLLPLAQGYCLSNLMLLLNLIEAWGCPSLFLSLCRLRATSPSQGGGVQQQQRVGI